MKSLELTFHMEGLFENLNFCKTILQSPNCSFPKFAKSTEFLPALQAFDDVRLFAVAPAERPWRCAARGADTGGGTDAAAAATAGHGAADLVLLVFQRASAPPRQAT